MRTPTSPSNVEGALRWLKEHSTQATLDGMALYAIPSDKALGVTVKDIRELGKQIGRNHALAGALWDTGVYEARMLTAFVGEPERLTASEMNRWCSDFDNWAICDTICFHLFDRTPLAWDRLKPWSRREKEFVKRAAFALLWGLTRHDKNASNDVFQAGLILIERASTDERNFVKKAVNMALRAVGKRNAILKRDAIEVARRLSESRDATARWIGKDALRELTPNNVRKAI